MLCKVKLKMEDLKNLLKEKHSYYNKKKIRLEKKLVSLLKGTITKRKIGHQYYYYLSYRKDKKVRHKYLGKKEPVELIKQFNKRRQLEKELREVKKTLNLLRKHKMVK